MRRVIRGSGIREVKTNQISKHATYDLLAGTLQSRLIKPRRKIKYFCVIRHPLLWYQSWFRYQHGRGWLTWGEKSNVSKWHCLSGINMEKQDDFNSFMTYINRNAPGFLTYLYHSYVFSSDARYLKNENLRDELLSLNSEWSLGLNESLILESKEVNVSLKSDIIWDEEVVAETLENELPLLKKYDYGTEVSDLINIKSSL